MCNEAFKTSFNLKHHWLNEAVHVSCRWLPSAALRLEDLRKLIGLKTYPAAIWLQACELHVQLHKRGRGHPGCKQHACELTQTHWNQNTLCCHLAADM